MRSQCSFDSCSFDSSSFAPSSALRGLPILLSIGLLGAAAPGIGAEKPESSDDFFGTALPEPACVRSAQPQETIVLATAPDNTLHQLLAQEAIVPTTPLSQLQDLDGQHWAVEALRQLSPRYNCLSSPPPHLPNPWSEDVVLSRDQFAEILNTCLDLINQRIQEGTAEQVTSEDQAIVQRLQEEFEAELRSLRGQIDNLEAQISTLETQQFVKRTTLFGTAEFVLLDTFGDSFDSPLGRRPTAPIPNANTTFTTGNVLLEVESKVRGQDIVRVGLFYSNLPANGRTDTGTDMTRLNVIPSSEGGLILNNLFYQARYAQRGIVRVGPVGLVANVIIPDLSPVQANSRFGARSPIYRLGVGGGFLTNYRVNDWLALGGGYTVGGGDGEDPSEGFFSAQNRFIVQSTFTPKPHLGIALTYSHVYLDDVINLTGLTGSRNAQAPFGDTTATSAHLLSLQGNYRLNKRVGIGGWVNYTQARAEENGTIIDPVRPRGTPIGTVTAGDKAESWNWAVGMTVADAFRKGNELGFIFGMPPKTVSNDFAPFKDKTSTSYHAEVYYRHRLTPRFSITPGIYAVFNPEHKHTNPTQVVGVVRSFMRF